MWVHTQPTAGPDSREDPPSGTRPCHPPEAPLGAGPRNYTLATAHRTPGRKQRDTWDELDGDPKAEGLGSLTKSR